MGVSRRTGIAENAPNLSTLVAPVSPSAVPPPEASMAQLTAHSVEAFSSLGYAVEGPSAYHLRWMEKVDHFFSVFANTLDLNRALVNLQSVTHDMFITRAEALVALADVDGNRFEAAANLLRKGYLQEVRLVVALLGVDKAIAEACRSEDVANIASYSEKESDDRPAKLATKANQWHLQQSREGWLHRVRARLR